MLNPTVTKRKAKVYVPKVSSFIITKAQLKIMQEIYDKEYHIAMYTDRANLEINFICFRNNIKLNRSILLALSAKQLIRYDYKSLTMQLTKLGNRIAKHKQKNPTKCGMVKAEHKNMTLTSDLKRALKSSIAFEKLIH